MPTDGLRLRYTCVNGRPRRKGDGIDVVVVLVRRRRDVAVFASRRRPNNLLLDAKLHAVHPAAIIRVPARQSRLIALVLSLDSGLDTRYATWYATWYDTWYDTWYETWCI